MELDEQLKRIEIGDNVKIEYYRKQRYEVKEGMVTNIDAIGKKVVLNEDEAISFFNIDKIFTK